MKTISLKYFTAIGLALMFVATGCQHKPVNVTQLPGRTGETIKDDKPSGIAKPDDTVGSTAGQPTALPDIDPDKMNQDRQALAANTVHFEYDSSAIKSSEKAHVQAVADYMKANGGAALLIEGHCDERGTEEYNRALGERRALALREALIALGADGMKIVTRSYGKDRKIDTGNSDAAHARNRRGEFVVLHPK